MAKRFLKDVIGLGQSANGGWSKEQLALIGVDWPPKKGWRKRVSGMVTEEVAAKFIAMKDSHLRK